MGNVVGVMEGLVDAKAEHVEVFCGAVIVERINWLDPCCSQGKESWLPISFVLTFML